MQYLNNEQIDHMIYVLSKSNCLDSDNGLLKSVHDSRTKCNQLINHLEMIKQVNKVYRNGVLN